MLGFSSSVRVYVYNLAVSMHSSFRRLIGLVSSELHEDSLSGHMFLFFNRPRSSVKILYFDRNGYVIWYKRLERGSYSIAEKREINYRELMCLLEGIEMSEVKKRKRYEREKS